MISLIKLTNGTEIIGDIIQHKEGVTIIKNPLQINYRNRVDMGAPAVYLNRYMPFAHVHEHMFRDEHIYNYSVPMNGLIKYYNATLNSLSDVDKSINDDLSDAASFYFGESEEDMIKKAMIEVATFKPTIN